MCCIVFTLDFGFALVFLHLFFYLFKLFLQDLKEFVDTSGDDGFIVFTLGSWVSDMPEAKAKQFFDAFRQIPQRVNNTGFLSILIGLIYVHLKVQSQSMGFIWQCFFLPEKATDKFYDYKKKQAHCPSFSTYNT